MAMQDEGLPRLMNERLTIEEGAIAVLRRDNPPWLSYVKGAWEPDRHGGLTLKGSNPTEERESLPP